jgi:hypothetical protein
MMYELLYYDGWGQMPAYYLLGGLEGDTPEDALRRNLQQATRDVRDLFCLSEDDMSDEDIQETLYVLRENGLVPVRDLARLQGA